MSATVNLAYNNSYAADLNGLGQYASIGSGLGPDATVDYSTGPSDHGQVFGGGLSLGVGAGLGASMGVTRTYALPHPINISSLLGGQRNRK